MSIGLLMVVACAVPLLAMVIWWQMNREEMLQEHLFLLEVDERYREINDRALAAEARGEGGGSASVERSRRLLEHMYGCGLLSDKAYDRQIEQMGQMSRPSAAGV